MNKIFSLIIVFLLFFTSSWGQSKKSLEQKKKQTQKEINYTNKLLRETQSSKKASFNELLLIEKKIQLRNDLLNNILQEQKSLKAEISENNEVIETLESDLIKIKAEYSKLLKFAYQHRNKNDIILFIFSAENFNQAFLRMKYIQQYSEYRKKQAKAIVETQAVLNNRIVELEEQKQSLDMLVEEHTQESVALRVEKSNQNTIVVSLQSEEQKLKDKLREANGGH